MNNNKFNNLLQGLEILQHYSPSYEISPIPNSFPNGSPNFSSDAYLGICIEHWPMPEKIEAKLKELGWLMEQEGEWWIFRN